MTQPVHSVHRSDSFSGQQPSPPGKAASNEHRVPELDGIRAIAVWMVLLAHAFFGFPNAPGALASVPSPVLQIIGHGWLGVDLFFLLSGFLITGILLDTKERPHYFRNFYVRRVLRIMPLYFTVIIVWSFFYTDSAAYFLLSSVFGANLSELLHIHEPHGPGVLWSLAVEEHFYLLWPLIVLVLNRRRLLIVSGAIFLAMPILRGIWAARGMPADTIYVLSWFRFDGLVGGAMMAMWTKSSFFSTRNAKKIAAGLALAEIVISLAGLKFGIFGRFTIAAVALRYTQTYLAFGALFILVVAHRASPWSAVLRSRFMQLSGALSYCIYLIHLSIGDGYEYLVAKYGIVPAERFGATGAVLLRTVVMVGLSFAVALVSRKYLEAPFLAMKDRFTRRDRPAAVAATPEPTRA
jgi:peptidoglycan/LPS O-acetylase OafA/YrhL